MIAQVKTKQGIFSYAGYLEDDRIDRRVVSHPDESGKHEQRAIGMVHESETTMADAELEDTYLPSDEPEELDEEDSDRVDNDLNIASIYLKEMNRIPLLSRKREIELAKRIQQSSKRIGDLIRQCPITTKEIEQSHQRSRKKALAGSGEGIAPKVIRKLLKLGQSAGEDSQRLTDLVERLREAEADVNAAKAEMIQSNLRLVVSIAKIYINRGLSFMDLIQEGNMGLMKAATRYDYRKGFKFSTYASWWIRQAITRALSDKSRTVRIPNHLLETRSKIVKAFHYLVKDLGRDPLPEEIAKRAAIPLGNVLKVMSLIQEPVSLETPVGEEGSRLQDLVGSEESMTFNDDLIETMDLAKKTRDLLSLLGPREEQILRLRFGIGMPSGYTLEEIGKQFGISRERVRQIEERALKKLKYPDRIEPDKAISR
jgi:RNA polymerase primary sigma factor